MRLAPRPNVRRTLVTAVTIAVLAAGCSGSSSGRPDATKSHHSAAPSETAATPVDLVGLWRVTQAAGEPAGSVLRLAGPQQPTPLVLFRHCGALSGNWEGSTSGGFLAIAFAFPEACLRDVGPGDPTPVWLAAARSFTVEGADRLLLDINGRVVARLLTTGPPPSAAATPPPIGVPPSSTTPVTLTNEERQALQSTAKPLPANAPPASPATIIGRWRPYPARHYETPHQPYLSFAVDGRFSGTDGCNVLGGSWQLGGAGELLTMTGASAGVGCRGAPLGLAPLSGRASVTGANLTLYGSDGHVLDRLTR